MAARPRLRPGLARVWRDSTTLQLGLFPGPGVVLSGLRAGDEAVLGALDGAHDLDQVRQVATAHQVGRRRVDELLELLERVRLLLSDDDTGRADRAHLARLGEPARARLAPDADAWSLVHDTDGLRLVARRAGRHVLVVGAGRVGSAVATTLAAAGVGTVRVRDTRPVRPGDVLPAGVGQDDVIGTWGQAIAAAFGRLTGAQTSGQAPTLGQAPTSGRSPTSGPAPPTTPDLVVLVGRDVIDARVGDDLVRRDVPHLAVVVGTDRVVVGPLVLPGLSPCLRCLDLQRRDRDPAWPHLVAQLLTAPDTSAVGETALSTAAAALAALQVLAHLDARVAPDAVGRTLEVSLPHGTVQRRKWRSHSGCGCVRLPERVAEDDAAGARIGATARPPPRSWPTMVR